VLKEYFGFAGDRRGVNVVIDKRKKMKDEGNLKDFIPYA